MNNNNLLPIGTVCKLKNGVKSLMITGFKPISNEKNEQRVFDYCGCLYPEGIVSSDMNFLFNHDQIIEIMFKGYECQEEADFKVKLYELIEETFAVSNNNDVKEKEEINNMDIPLLSQQEKINNQSSLEVFNITE